jgi:hypothetical protein
MKEGGQTGRMVPYYRRSSTYKASQSEYSISSVRSLLRRDCVRVLVRQA